MTNELGPCPATEAVSRRTARPRRPTQLDLVLPVSPMPARRTKPGSPERLCPRRKANWWFDQMRQLVAEGREMDAPGVF